MLLAIQPHWGTEEADVVMAEDQPPPSAAPTGLLNSSSRVSILPEVSEIVPSLMFQNNDADCPLVSRDHMQAGIRPVQVQVIA